MTVVISKNATGKYVLTIEGEQIIFKTPVTSEFDKALLDANLIIEFLHTNLILGEGNL